MHQKESTLVGTAHAPVTSAPARRKVSMMHTDSISSDPLAIGTSTLFAMAKCKCEEADKNNKASPEEEMF